MIERVYIDPYNRILVWVDETTVKDRWATRAWYLSLRDQGVNRIGFRAGWGDYLQGKWYVTHEQGTVNDAAKVPLADALIFEKMRARLESLGLRRQRYQRSYQPFACETKP